MRVLLKGVVGAAVERGVAAGYHRVTKLSRVKRANTDMVVDTILTSIWKSLDGIIDFSDDTEEEKEKPSRRRMGFSQTDAVSTDTPGTDDEEEEEDSIPIEVIYRVHKC